MYDDPSHSKYPLGAVVVHHIAINPVATAYESTYALVAASVLSVGVARFVIFCEFNETLALGAVILLRVVVDK